MSEPWPTGLSDHIARWGACTRCNLCSKYRVPVFYRASKSDPPYDVVFLGEAPGFNEESEALPFVGDSGRILNSIIARVQTMFSFSYAIGNVVLSMPYKDKSFTAPTAGQIKKCSPRVMEFVNHTDPKAIVLLGKSAEKILKYCDFSVPVLKTVHPSYLLRNGGLNAVKYMPLVVKLNHFLAQHLEQQDAQKTFDFLSSC